MAESKTTPLSSRSKGARAEEISSIAADELEPVLVPNAIQKHSNPNSKNDETTMAQTSSTRSSHSQRNMDDNPQDQDSVSDAPDAPVRSPYPSRQAQRKNTPPEKNADDDDALLNTSIDTTSNNNDMDEDENDELYWQAIHESLMISTSNDGDSPSHSPFSPYSQSRPVSARSTLKHVQRVSKRAALATKAQLWDSNTASIVAAQSAVDMWEALYRALRQLTVAGVHSAGGVYRAAKTGAIPFEWGGVWVVRLHNWIVVPTLQGVEQAAHMVVGYATSPQCKQLVGSARTAVEELPWIGESVVAPTLKISIHALQQAWGIAQYPIPSPSQVASAVNAFRNGVKFAVVTTGREVSLYVQRADANLTRTLSHTQWKVLGSGPYETLDKLNKAHVIDHLCDRYLHLDSAIARYEWVAHVKWHNFPLYKDLVVSGLLQERGGLSTEHDVWLSLSPCYRETTPFLLKDEEQDEQNEEEVTILSGTTMSNHHHNEKRQRKVVPLWFRLPLHNGKRPPKDTPWIMIQGAERQLLEDKYTSLVAGTEPVDNSFLAQDDCVPAMATRYPSNAQWYNPRKSDIFLEQRRLAVSFSPCCPSCRKALPEDPKKSDNVCSECANNFQESNPDTSSSAERPNKKVLSWEDTLKLPPPFVAVSRPTLWRFYGGGDPIRRSVWCLDTQKHGLQPYNERAQAVLEDAYLFLLWRQNEQNNAALNDNRTEKDDEWEENVILTVQVPSPDEKEQQLVQFSSLTSATAINKGLGGAISLFKRRVYRGASFPLPPEDDEMDEDPAESSYGDDSADIDLDTVSMHDNLSMTSGSDANHVTQPDYNHDPHSFDLPTFGIMNLDTDMDLETRSVTSVNPSEVDLYDIGDIGSDIDSVTGLYFPDPSLMPKNEKEKAEDNVLPSEEEAEMLDTLEEIQKEPAVPTEELMAYPMTLPEDDSLSFESEHDDTADHLVLIVHGIGEMLQSIDLFGLSKLPTIVDCCNFLRKNHSEVNTVRMSSLYQTIDGMAGRISKGRVEYLPVEWHEAFTILSQRRLSTAAPPSHAIRGNVAINDVSLKTIPQMRQFANDTLMDVLYFMSPEHHDIIIDIVVNEMNLVVQKFRDLTGFAGDISLIGHSLGSIISWDILEHQMPEANTEGPSKEEDDDEDGDSPTSSAKEACVASPAERMYPQLSFPVDNAFMLGSPIAVFLMIRNQTQPLSQDFSLRGCSRVFNIFHPYDPIAYRIEPLLDQRNAEIEPKIMTHWHGGFRIQYQTKRLWKKIVDKTLKTQENIVDALESGIAAMGLLGSNSTGDEEQDDSSSASSSTSSRPEPLPRHRLVTGNLNKGQRIDYMIQEKEIEAANEYFAALAAHSCYWLEKDLSLFVARQICLRELERSSS